MFPRRWARKLRWLTGRGWSAADFADRYAAGGADAWGYQGSPQHEQRADWIMAALPEGRFGAALEVGCAQGFLSRRLAARTDRLVACDIAPEAIRRAREGGLQNVEFRVADIRSGFPGERFDLCLFSDVLYYLSPRETDSVLAEAGRKTATGGWLLIANEWTGRAGGLNPPDYAFARLESDPAWARVALHRRPLGDAELSIALYRRRPA